MVQKVKTKTKYGKLIYRVYYDDGKPSKIEQKIVQIGKDMLKVISSKGNEYWVQMSDKVVMTMNPQPQDIAIICTFKEKWLVVDIIKYVEPIKEYVSEEELSRQIKSAMDLLGGY